MNDNDNRFATHPDAPARVGPPPLPAERLRWRCDPESLPFDSTRDVEPEGGVIGQETAMEALRFGLECRAAGQNVFVRGLTGTGRLTMVERLLGELQPTCPEGCDRVYVYNFSHPDRPKLINLPKGRGREFRRLFDQLADFIRDDLEDALTGDAISARRNAIDQNAQDEMRAISEPFEQELRDAGMTLQTRQAGPMTQVVIAPLVEGKPMPPEEFRAAHERGEIQEDRFQEFRKKSDEFEKRLREEVRPKINEVRQKHDEEIRNLVVSEARSVLGEFTNRIRRNFPQDEVKRFVEEIIDDVVEQRLDGQTPEGVDFTRLYRVNLISEHAADERCPVVIENTPTMSNLLGGVDRELSMSGAAYSDHLMVRAGSLLRADGGYLIVEARDVLSEAGAWKVLVRTLRSGRLEIVPPEFSVPWIGHTVKPEPIDVDVKVVLLGDSQIFYVLDAMDPDFPNLFKLLADFDTQIPRDEKSIRHYAGVLSRIQKEENLLSFDRAAIAALVEHGARIVSRTEKLTARFGRLVDLAREASYVASKAGRGEVTGEDVRETVARTKRRANLPSRRFREFLADGTIRVQTRGRVVGQINGLAVQHAGPMTSGFPARITATIGPGTAGVINIEREAALSGAIHTKGFYILGGLLRQLLQTDHPLAFDASVAFEQSYGGIDGDSASGAEICCLISALTDVPLRQDVAMTGAIDQKGHILAIGAANEKIEGFFDTCRDTGLTGEQGVIIPKSNAGDLMLRHDVVDAAREGKFHVWAVDTVHEALELLTGMPAGRRDETTDKYPEGTLLALAVERALHYWERAAPNLARRLQGDASASAALASDGDDEEDTDIGTSQSQA